ncbi:MAG: hypothetical protein ACYDH9_19110 [Limisphaerales bacterium]
MYDELESQPTNPMRNHHQLPLGSLLAALLTGCAGYNHTFFMTKSNAGLDFDAKPPTAEINVSRKEAVIAPAFEGGQTPPVMASFMPKTGFHGSFLNFFVGVDQTFAGGDAAKTMAVLYDQEATPPETNRYDSTLKLSTRPKYENVFQRIPGPGEVRPFIFGTDTSLGLKVAWSGAGGQMPDTVKAGFNRKEFAWAPLTMSQDRKDTNTPYHVSMPAFLATIQSRIEVDLERNGTSGISALQYFATGDAAAQLARQYAVREAMLRRSDPLASKIAETQANLGKTAAKGSVLAKQASIETDRLPDAQLDQAADALQKAGLIDSDQTRELKAKPATEKRGLLKKWTQGYTSPDDVNKLEIYFNSLKLIK